MSSAKFFLLLLSADRMGMVNVATVVNVATDEERIIDSLIEMLKLGQDINAEFLSLFSQLKFGSDMEHRVWSRF